jgi:carboxypeptidase family protein
MPGKIELGSRVIGFALLLAVFPPVPGFASAQSIEASGIVLDGTSGQPLRSARVTLRSPTHPLETFLTDESGRFLIRVDGSSGTVTVTAMGMSTWSREISTAGSVDLGQISLEPAPIVLEGLAVSAESECAGESDDLRAGHHRLSSLRPFFETVAANGQMAEIEYLLELVRPVKTFRKGSSWYSFIPDTVKVRAPAAHMGENPATLVTEGFAHAVSDSVNVYRSVTAEWLASDEFVNSYCITPAEDGPDQGLRFWPKRSQGRVGVSGHVWIGDSGNPSSVEYRFTEIEPFTRTHEMPWLERVFQIREGQLKIPNIDLNLDEENHGGRLTFAEVSPGFWVTTSWSVSGVSLMWEAGWRLSELSWVRANAHPLTTSGRLLALLPRTDGRP